MPSPLTDSHAYLFASVRLPDFLEFIKRDTLADSTDLDGLAQEWRQASASFEELQQVEAGWAEQTTIKPLPKLLESAVREVAADPIFRRAFSAVPGEVGLVELDRLVVSQRTVNLTHVARIREKLGPGPQIESIFRTCLPVDHPAPPCRSGQVAKNSFVFVSDSNDLRFLDTRIVEPELLPSFLCSGPLVGLVAAGVGYGSNYLNALTIDGRLLLNNGYHRAYALRSCGVTHVPCVVQRLSSREDLELVGRPAIRRDMSLYLDRPRPPVLKDLFDARLTRTVVRPRVTRQVRVTVTVEELDVPA